MIRPDLPYMAVFVADEIADAIGMGNTAFAAYYVLRCHYWRRGNLPATDAELARLAGVSDSVWAEIRDIVATKFDDGWMHPAIEKAHADAAEQKQKAYVKAVNAAKARHGGKGKSATSNAPSTSTSNAPSSPTSNARSNAYAIPSTSNVEDIAYENKAPTRAREPNIMTMPLSEAAAYLERQEKPVNAYAAAKGGIE
jgi:uncharacterized protein YdaU (DUF1376 family)